MRPAARPRSLPGAPRGSPSRLVSIRAVIGTSAAAAPADGAQQQRAGADPAAEHDELGIENRAHRRDRGAQARGDMVDHRARDRRRPTPASSNTSCASRRRRRSRRAGDSERGDDPGGADLVLEAAVQAVARVERVADERQVADLAGGAVGATDELVVDDDAHPDARADPDEHQRRDAARQAEPLLADRREVDVVVDEHGQVEAVADHRERVEAALGRHVVGQRRDPAARADRPPRGSRSRVPADARGTAPARSITSLIISRICTPTARLPSLVVGRLRSQIGSPNRSAAATRTLVPPMSAPSTKPARLEHHVGDGLAAALARRACRRPRTRPACSSR